MKKYPYSTHVKPNLMFRVSAKRLANLPNIVKNWLQNHEYFDFTFDKTLGGVKLLFILYYALRSREFDLRDKEAYISQLTDLQNKLQSDYKNLENELKSYKYANYTFHCIRVEWDCGDGCCSDSWYEYEVLNDKMVKIDSGGGRTWSKDELKTTLKEKYGLGIRINHYYRNFDNATLHGEY